MYESQIKFYLKNLDKCWIVRVERWMNGGGSTVFWINKQFILKLLYIKYSIKVLDKGFPSLKQTHE